MYLSIKKHRETTITSLYPLFLITSSTGYIIYSALYLKSIAQKKRGSLEALGELTFIKLGREGKAVFIENLQEAVVTNSIDIHFENKKSVTSTKNIWF